jgi:Putative NADPH-quinone reductase (modulator of drug activity B)
MKTLIIVIHPDIKNSVINKRWIKELEKSPEKYHVHQLHEVYPTQQFDIAAEQKLIEEHDRIVLQFPYYWFNCPALLKKWMDEVFTHGWAYGSQSGHKLRAKKFALAISLGLKEEEVQPGATYKYSLEEMTRPFELTFEYLKADYRPLFAYYGMTYNPSEEWVEKSVPLYLKFLDQFKGNKATQILESLK